MQTISSKYTFFYKYIFILIWIFGFGTGTRDVLFINPQFDAKWLQYAATWLIVGLFIYLATGSIKIVSLDRENNRITVSNFIKTEVIGRDEIIAIDGSSLLSPKLVWFLLKKDSSFGRRITFMPAHKPSRPIGKHPLVSELRREFKLGG